MRRSSALVGREYERHRFRSAVEAARNGRGGAVFLVGDSGIGKSRLLADATEAAFTSELTLLRGRGSTIDPVVPFRPLTEALLSLLRTSKVDLTELGPYGPILGRLVPELGEPVAEGHGTSVVILAEAVLRLTALAGRDGGCLLSLDDLHNADSETLAVLEYLLDNLDTQPTLVIGVTRDVDCPARDLAMAAAQRDQCQVLTVGPLGRREVGAVAASCLDVPADDLPAEVTELLWAGSAGNPFLVEQLVAGLVDAEILVHGPGSGAVRLTTELPSALPADLTRPMARRVAELSERTRHLLSIAAVFGQRFPLSLVRRVSGLDDRDLLTRFNDDLAGHLVAPDEELADHYCFHHQLGREAVLAQLTPDRRARLAEEIADALDVLHPGLPGAWCQTAASLRLAAGDERRAATLFAEAGERALALGAADSAVAALERSWELSTQDSPSRRATTLERLILALAEAGLVERALAATELLDQVGGLDPVHRARLHARLAWAATVAGRTEDGLSQVDAARALLGPVPSDGEAAAVDVIAAHLALDVPGPDRLAVAERLARRAAEVAERVPLPVVGCQAWQLLGAITRHRDQDEATRSLERARALAVRHELPIWEIHALIRLGNDDALRTAALTRLERARDQASAVGAITARYQAEASIALHLVLRGDHDAAGELIDQLLPVTTRLRLLETTQYVLLLRAVLAGHRGRRTDLDEAIREFVGWSGDPTAHAARVHGLAGAFCALLEEDRERARGEVALAIRGDQEGSGALELSGRNGLGPLLDALSGDGAPPDATGPRWDAMFARFAAAVHLGRSGDPDAAAAVTADGLALAEPFRMARHLALRLVAEAALADGWGEPASWLRTAEDYFHRTGVDTVAAACRALLRQAGEKVSRRRADDDVPPSLRTSGVTSREFEVLRLLVQRLGNREIADRLHLSPRTVERHVSSLIVKTGLPNRRALGELAAELAEHP